MHRVWQSIRNAFAFISGGGGLFQDVTGKASPLYYGGLIEIARLNSTPVAFFGQGIGPLNTGMGVAMTKRALKQSSLVILRDSKSQAIAEKLSGRHCRIMADPVWTWEGG